jgi:hypothetical protein
MVKHDEAPKVLNKKCGSFILTLRSLAQKLRRTQKPPRHRFTVKRLEL